MRKLFSVLVVIAVLYGAWTQFNSASDSSAPPSTPDTETLTAVIRDHKSGVQVTGEGTVTKVLSDDTDGSRHQRFILSLAPGQTLLIAHNIDLAPRVPSLKRGDSVAFNGVYEWNAKGGVVHWTHHDPDGQHEAGWLRHKGRTFQ